MRSTHEAELARTRKRLRQIVDAIAEGVSVRTLKHALLTLEAREDFLISQLAASPEQKVLLNPRVADIYRDRVARLHDILAGADEDIEAIETLRSLIDKVVVKLVEGKPTIDFTAKSPRSLGSHLEGKSMLRSARWPSSGDG